MVETVAEQTDSASENADTAGKDWNGDPSDAPGADRPGLSSGRRPGRRRTGGRRLH